MCVETHDLRKGPRVMGKKIHPDVPIEMPGSPGATDRGARSLRKSFADNAISTNFIDGPSCFDGKTPNMRQLFAHLRARVMASSLMDLFQIPAQKRARGTAELADRDSS